MKKFFLLCLSMMMFAGINFVLAQGEESNVLNGVYQKIHIAKKIPVPFEYLREADVMWSKTVWRKIDLREKINHPYYYPETQIGDRKSLIDLLLYGIKYEGLKAYSTTDDANEFKQEITMAEIEERLGGGIDSITQIDENGNPIIKSIAREIKTYDVKQYLIKEVWFFDKQRSVLDVRMVGICPIREYFKPEDTDQEDVKMRKLFWIYYPDVRPLFAKNPLFNEFNDAEYRSFDDMFLKRMFSSYIVQESNVYNNRLINDYTLGVESLMEAERIKNEIFNFEQELWEY